MSTKFDSEILLYVYFVKNPHLITCQCCFKIPEDIMYKIRNTNLSYCKYCINIWLNNKCINPITRKKLEKNDIEINYEINELIEIYTKYKKLKLKIKNINIDLLKEEENDILLEC
jgi:hypothetical protein